MIRYVAPVAIVVGLTCGVAFPRLVAGHETGEELAVALTPPTLSSGSSPYLNCGWHSICQDPWPDGHGLDWEDGGGYGNSWYFRGFFYVSDSSRTAFHMFPLEVDSGPSVCDKMTVWIAEKHSGALMAIPTFTHVNITDDDDFEWTGSQWTTYHNREIGETIDENDLNCSSGSHVHEAHVPWETDDVDIDENRADYETGEDCHTAGGCDQWQNNDIDNWTRSWTWDEGVISH